MKDIRIAVVIFQSNAGKTDINLKKTVSITREAKRQNAKIVCFPELNITGYGLNDAIRISAESIPGPTTKILAENARRENIIILAGIAEKGEESQLFASHVVVMPDGVINVYRKLHIAPPEQDFFTPGNKIPIFEAAGLKFGIQLCYDAHFPELSTKMALNGADVIFMPHASPRGAPDSKFKSWMRHLPARAFDNGIFIVACNHAGENVRGLNFPGLALVIGPSGDIIRKDVSGKEGILIADLKADDLDYIRNHRMRYFLPNRRGDIY